MPFDIYQNFFPVQNFPNPLLLVSILQHSDKKSYILNKNHPIPMQYHREFKPPKEIVLTAKRKGISVVALTDKASARWEYGLWPLSNLLKKTVTNNSILGYGARRYLDEIKELEAEFPQMIILPGLDAAPFYYWSGSYRNGDLTINNWHKHLIAIGLFDESDYKNVPVIGNWFGIALTLVVFAFLIFGFLVALTIFFVLSERKIASHFQDRVGPMRVGPHGIFQSIIDTVKLLAKEDIIPQETSKRLFKFAPYLVFGATFAAFAAIPFGNTIEIGL